MIDDKVSHEQLKLLVEICYEKRKPLFVMGGTGIGKSMIVRDAAKSMAKKKGLQYTEIEYGQDKFTLTDIRISQLDPSDLRGLPTFDKELGVTKWLPPNWLPKEGQGLIFFDELNLAPPSIQAAAYQLVLDRKLGDYRLPDGFNIISAGNRLEDRANVFELPAPLANRFLHCELKVPSVEEWTNWALNNGIDSRIITFLNFRKSYLYKFESKNRDKAFPTPRIWSYCSDLIADYKDMDMLEMLTATAIGQGATIEFMAFLKLQRKINLEDYLKRPDTIVLPTEIDLKYALISALAEHYKEHIAALPSILKLTNRVEPEYGHLLLRSCKMLNPKFEKQVNDDKTCQALWQGLAKSYAKYLL